MIAMAFSDDTWTAEQVFEALAETEHRSTMGKLMNTLREKSSLEHRFDDLLRVVLKKRNQLIHHLHEIPGANFMTNEGQAVIIEYCDELLSEAGLLHEVILAVIANWMDKQGIDLGGAEAAFARELRQRHGHHLAQTFFSKQAGA